MATDRLIAGIVLVGGASTRMGTDKASLVVDGEAMLAHCERILGTCGITDIVVAGTDQVPDAGASGERQGPMAGIVGGWSHLRSISTAADRVDLVVVLACDLPAITEHVVRALVEAGQSTSYGAVAHDGERPQPLIAAYRPQALDAFEQAFEAGERSVRRCFVDWDLQSVSFAPEVLADADYPEDLDGFRVDWPVN